MATPTQNTQDEAVEKPILQMDDTSRPYGEIHPTAQSLRNQMVEIAKCAHERTDSKSWVANLRFLDVKVATKDRVQGKNSVQGDTATYDLVLGAESYSSESTPYIAVSYCWYRQDVDWFSQRKLPAVSIWKNGTLSNTSGSDVLYRLASFAQHHQCPHLWVDEHCIDQSDPVDKQAGIQAMDLVYQNATYPVAVLETHIDTQDEMNAFASIFTGEMDDAEVLEDLESVLDVLADDFWFTRAWTLQEAVSSGLTMRLLIGCTPSLTKPEDFGTLDGEVQIGLRDLQEAMVAARGWMEEIMAAGALEDETLAVVISNLADDILGRLPTLFPGDQAEFPDVHRRVDRQICTAAEAVNMLRDRQNTVFSDRIDIIGNLCDYNIRLDQAPIQQNQYSFSTCVMTVAILNGDWSLLDLYFDPESAENRSPDGARMQGVMSDPIHTTMERYGFSWCPKSTYLLNDVQFMADREGLFRLTPSSLSSQGLQVRGVLWEPTEFINVPDLSDLLKRCLEELKKGADDPLGPFKKFERFEPLDRDLAAKLLKSFYRTGFPEVALALWKIVRPSSRASDSPFSKGFLARNSPAKYAFEEIFGPTSRFQIDDIKHELRMPSITPEIQDPHGGPWHSTSRQLLNELHANGGIVVARPVPYRSVSNAKVAESSAKASLPCRAYFECTQPGDLIFTPWTDLGDDGRIRESSYDAEAVSWKVVQPVTSEQSDSGTNTLSCVARRRGWYYMDDLTTAIGDYILR